VGTIANASGLRRTLAARTLVGRTAASVVRLESPRVSAEHAVIFHDGDEWLVRDLGSTNGTWLDDQPLSPGSKHVLQEGATLCFGERDEVHSWQLVTADPPCARARCIEGGVLVEAVEGLLQLPDADSPQITVFYDDTQSSWYAETPAGLVPTEDQRVLQIGSASYLLELPPIVDATTDTRQRKPSPSLQGAELRFAVSRDEEHVDVELRTVSGSITLASRSFHYLLVTLARKRVADDALPSEERGWVHVEELMEQLRVSRQKLNLDVSRARRQIADAGVAHAMTLIERRPRASQLRLGVERVEVRRT